MPKPKTRSQRKPVLKSERLLVLVADKRAKAKKLFVPDPYNITIGAGPSLQQRHEAFVENSKRILKIAPLTTVGAYTTLFLCGAAKLVCLVQDGINIQPAGSPLSEYWDEKLILMSAAASAVGFVANTTSRITKDAVKNIEMFEDVATSSLGDAGLTRDELPAYHPDVYDRDVAAIRYNLDPVTRKPQKVNADAPHLQLVRDIAPTP